MKGQDKLFSSKSDDWSTPSNIYDFYVKDRKFKDPCPLHAPFDALEMSWSGYDLFINPPYSKMKDFVKKFKYKNVVWLVPARTDTKWFHELMEVATTIYFIKGRLKFGGSNNSAPFPSCLIFTNNMLTDIPNISGKLVVIE